jgi:YVTN family beta-propeller protein
LVLGIGFDLLLMHPLTRLTCKRSRFGVIVVAAFLTLSPLILSTSQFALADSVTSTVKVGDSPTEIAFNPINGSMYVVNSLDQLGNGVSVIDGRTNKFLMNITVPITFPNAVNIAFNSNNSNMYVTNSTSVAIISAIDNKVIKNIPMGVNSTIPNAAIPNAIAFNPKNGNMYVPATVFYNSFNIRNNCVRNVTIACVVSVIDSHNQIIKNIPVGRQGDPEARGIIAFDPVNGDMYVGNERDRSISVIDSRSNEVVTTIPLSGSPSAIAFNPKNGNMYVAGGASNVVSVIDSTSNKVIKPITGVGTVPNAMAFNPKNGNMYVAGGFSKSIFVIDSEHNQIIKNIPVGRGLNDVPNAIAFNPKNGNMYVTIGFSNVVSVIDSTSNQVVDTVPVEEGALKIALDPINNDMYVTNTLNNTVSVIG